MVPYEKQLHEKVFTKTKQRIELRFHITYYNLLNKLQHQNVYNNQHFQKKTKQQGKKKQQIQ